MNRDLDRRIAELKNWDVKFDDWNKGSVEGGAKYMLKFQKNGKDFGCSVQPYSTNIECAWELFEEMPEATSITLSHVRGIYQEMKGEVERHVFEIDYKKWLKQMMEDVSIAEFEELVIGVPLHVRGESRRNQRNGFYERNFDTVFGWIEGLRVPRPRVGGFTPVWERNTEDGRKF